MADEPVRTVRSGKRWYMDWHVLIAFFFIGTGIGIPVGIAMLLWRAWKEYQGQYWVRHQEIGDLNSTEAEKMK
jgi:ABC-type nitrate/sulfonate/bicarbonate transport system permease component